MLTAEWVPAGMGLDTAAKCYARREVADEGSKSLLDKARIAATSQQWAEARVAYEELLRRFPDDVSNAYALAEVYQRLKMSGEAIATYQWIAGRFAAKGELLRAIAALQGILKIDPQHAETQRTLADLYAKRKAEGAPTPGGAPRLTPKPNARGGSSSTSAGVASVAPMGGAPEAPKAPKRVPTGESDVVDLSDDHLVPLTESGSFLTTRPPDPPKGEPVRRVKGPGEPPPGFPHAIPLRYASVPLFSALSTRTFVKVIGQVKVHRLGPDTIVVREGEKGDAIFAVAEGQVRVTKEVGTETLELATLPAGSFFGEMAMLTGAPRRATVSSVGDVEILEIPQAALDDLASEVPTVGETLRRFCRERLLQTALATGVLFRGLPPADRDQLVHRFRTLDARSGTRLLEEGKDVDGLYVVVDGVLQVTKKDGAGKARLLALLRGGDFFGEMSLVSGGSATATVGVKEHATLLKLARPVCEEMLRARPELLSTIKRVADERRRANDKAIGAGKTVEGASPA